MKILAVHNRYRSASPSGEDRVVDEERAQLLAAGHDVSRFERRSDDIATFPLTRKALLPAQVVWNPGSGRDFALALRRYRPDVVHIHNLFPLLSPSILQVCRRERVPCVVTLHNFRLVCAGSGLFREGGVCRDCVDKALPVPAVVHGCYRDSALATVPRAASIVAHRKTWQQVPAAYIFISEAQRRELEPVGLPSSRSFVKPNLVPRLTSPESTAQEVALPARSGGLIAFLGRLTEEKGLRVLMAAWDHYLDTRPSRRLRLAIAGAGPLEAEVASWARSRPSVDHLGLLGKQACAELTARASAVVIPSEWPEPFGLVVLEAMAAGAPPIATDHGAFGDLITQGHDGILYPPGDHASLSTVLGRIDDDPAWAEGLGKAAQETYETRFRPERNLAELERIYRFAIDNPR